jgi:signal transduction histidine kinase
LFDDHKWAKRNAVAGGTLRAVAPSRERYVWALIYARAVVLSFACVAAVAAATGLVYPPAQLFLIGSGVVYLAVNYLFVPLFRAAADTMSVAFVALVGSTALMTVTVYATGGVTSPLVALYGPAAAVAGVYLPFRYSARASALAATFLAGVGTLEYRGVIPHVPMFADGTDPGLYRHAGYVAVISLAVLVKMATIALGSDYLNRKLHERERELATQEERRWATLGQFSAVVAHEVKNPLAGIKGAADLIAAETETPQVQHLAHAIADEVKRLDRLVVHYLRFARPLPVAAQPVAVNEVVKKAVAMFGIDPEQAASVPVRYEFDEALPSVLADAEQLYEAVLNLLENARQAVVRDGEIRVRTRRQEGGVAIVVADTGPGVAPDVLPHIFEPFFSTKGGGSGLGLAVVRRIVEGFGGRIEARNGEHEGAIFTIWLREAAA